MAEAVCEKEAPGAGPAEVAVAAAVVSALFLSAPDEGLRAVLGDVEAADQWPLDDPASRQALVELARGGVDEVDDLVQDHFMLFVGPGRGWACPYESVHVSDDQLMQGPATEQVRAVMAELGLVVHTADAEPADHIGLEFSLVAACCQRLATELLADERERVGMLLGGFLTEHLGAFAPQVLAMVAEHARTRTYQALPVLARGVLSAAGELVAP